MPNNKRILIAVDGSAASRRAVDYVAEILTGRPDYHIGLLHLKLPPGMAEWGGSEDPEIEDRVSTERAEIYKEMENKTIEKGQDLLQELQSLLSDRGIDVAGLIVEFEEPLSSTSISNHILKTAAERDYGTVVVGRHSFSGLKRLFGHHVGEKLISTDGSEAIWVVA